MDYGLFGLKMEVQKLRNFIKMVKNNSLFDKNYL